MIEEMVLRVFVGLPNDWKEFTSYDIGEEYVQITLRSGVRLRLVEVENIPPDWVYCGRVLDAEGGDVNVTAYEGTGVALVRGTWVYAGSRGILFDAPDNRALEAVAHLRAMHAVPDDDAMNQARGADREQPAERDARFRNIYGGLWDGTLVSGLWEYRGSVLLLLRRFVPTMEGRKSYGVQLPMPGQAAEVSERRAEKIAFAWTCSAVERGYDLFLARQKGLTGEAIARGLLPNVKSHCVPSVIDMESFPWVNWECLVGRRTYRPSSAYGGLNVEGGYSLNSNKSQAYAVSAKAYAALDAACRGAVLMRNRIVRRSTADRWRVVIYGSVPVPFFLPRYRMVLYRKEREKFSDLAGLILRGTASINQSLSAY
jgi:hypothetical protein